MFLRRRGRRIYLLHSYRDGRGQVCQRRLGHFSDAAALTRGLDELPTRCPEISGETLSKLRDQAEAMLDNWDVKESQSERIRRATRALLTMLAEESEEVLREVPELELLKLRLSESVETGGPCATEVQKARSHVPPRRRRLDPTEKMARPYIDSTNRLAKLLTEQNRLPESSQLLKQRVDLCPTIDARLALGAVLHKLGRRSEALEQYSFVPNAYAYRHYNSASAHWEEGRPEEALIHLLRGVMREPRVAEALRRGHIDDGYWREFGDCWSDEGKRFARVVCSQLLVRWRLQQARARGVVLRNLVPVRSRPWFLKRVLEALPKR